MTLSTELRALDAASGCLRVLASVHPASTPEEGTTRKARAHTRAGSRPRLRAPRIMLIAAQFPSNTTATAVWLSEMGIDITLTRLQAYRTQQETVITVSQHYPPPDVEEFLVAPTRASRRARPPDLPEVPWTTEDLTRLAEMEYATIRTTMDLCAQHPGEWVPSEAVRAVTGREPAQHRGDYGGFGVTLRNRFKRSNTPFQGRWAVDGTNQVTYMLDAQTAEMWLAARGQAGLTDDSALEAMEPSDGALSEATSVLPS